MASHKTKTEGDIFRKSFDAVYVGIDHAQHIDLDEAQHKLSRLAQTNRRILGMSLVITAAAVLLIVLVFLLQSLASTVNWQNRPTFAQRLTSPYGLENTLPPYLLNAVQVDAEFPNHSFQTSNIQTYPENERPQSSQLLSQVVKLQSIMPAQIDNYTLLWNRKQSFLLSNCLLQSAVESRPSCWTPHTAEFVEAGNYVDAEGGQVSLTMTKFADADKSLAVYERVYRYARSIGRIGNFSSTDLLNVDYFYSSTRDAISFTWINQNWVFTAASDNIETLDGFMNQFPLYENNPNLANSAVVQISRDSGLKPIVAPEPASAISDTSAVSGTE